MGKQDGSTRTSEVWETLKMHFKGIISVIELDLSNSVAEGINNKSEEDISLIAQIREHICLPI